VFANFARKGQQFLKAFASKSGLRHNFLSTTAPLWTGDRAIFGLRMEVIGYARVSTAEQASGGISLFVGPNTVEVAGKTLPFRLAVCSGNGWRGHADMHSITLFRSRNRPIP